MPSRVLETILTGKNLLSPVLASAARDVESYDTAVERANVKATASTGALRDELGKLDGTRANVKVTADTAGASAELDRFAGEAKAKGGKSGNDAGGALAQGMRLSFIRNSPLIAAAVGGALIAGGPAVLAGAGVLFGGIAAAAVHSNVHVAAAFQGLKATITSTLTGAAQSTVPMFTAAMGQIAGTVRALEPQLAAAFSALGGPISSLSGGLVDMVRNVLPGLVAAVRSAGPVFAGLASLLAQVGTGLGQMFQTLSQHSGAAGQVFDQLGKVIGTLLPVIGQLLGAGTELASTVLPPVVSILQGLAGALNVLAPVLPEVAAGLAAFMVVKTLTGPLELLSAKLQTVAADGGKFATALAGRGAAAASTFGAALPAIGAGLAVLGGLYQAQVSTVNNWAQAIEQGGSQAATAMAEMKRQENASLAPGDWWERAKGLWNDGIAQIQGYANAQDEATQAAKRQYDALSPLGKAQQDVTTAQNDLSYAVSKYGAGSGQAMKASANYASKQQALKLIQEQLTAATTGTSVATQQNADRLTALANTASAAQSAINLLKGALDALTGTAVTTDQAQIAVTQAVHNAVQSIKGQKGALVDVNGHLNLYTAKGAAAAQGLMALASAQHNEIAVMEKHGATAGQVAARSAEMRAQFIKTATQMGLNADEAKRLADRYYGIPSKVKTEIEADTAAATAAAKAFETYWNGIKSRKVTLTYDEHHNITSKSFGGVGNAGTTMKAAGGIVHAYADGGIEPMRAGVAEVVHPNTLRVIGDRVTDDEAYIPINRSSRSKQILGETAQRMGYKLAAFANGGYVRAEDGSYVPSSFYSKRPASERRPGYVQVDGKWMPLSAFRPGGSANPSHAHAEPSPSSKLRANVHRAASNVGDSLVSYVDSGLGKALTGTPDQVVAGVKNVAAKVLAAEKSGAAARLAIVRAADSARTAATTAANAKRLAAIRATNADSLAEVRKANAAHTAAAAHTSAANRGAVSRANAARLAAVEDTNRKALASTEAYNRKATAATAAYNKKALADNEAFNKTALDRSTLYGKQLAAADAPLYNMAKARQHLADQLTAAKAKLTDALKLRDDYATQVRSSAEQYANLTQVQATRGLPLTSKQIVTDLQTRLAAITKFRANLATLAKSGLSKTAYDEIAQAGVDGGSATAAALVAGGKTAVAQLNTVQGQIDKASTGLGSDASRTMYQAGVNVAQGLVNGLEHESANLTAAAKHLAATLTGEVKKALGIHSPSRVFHELGGHVGQGMVNGLAAMRPAVAAEMRALADTQALSGLSPSSMPGYGAAASPGIDYQRLGQAVAAAMQSSGRTGPMVEMHNPVFGSHGAARDFTQELAYAARTRGW